MHWHGFRICGMRCRGYPAASTVHFMKAKFTVLFLAAASLFISACEQHKWEETKKLFQESESEKKEEAKSGEKEAKPEAAATEKKEEEKK